ncbi:MAG: tRNA lysidine(34) synthetase TilS [Candidatus Acetothermia bacterium]
MKIVPAVREFLTEHSIKECGVLVAVSGGVDSLSLLHVLLEEREDFDLELSVAHLDHGIRGEDATKDAEFVRSTAQEFDLDSIVASRSAKELAEEKGLSLEEAARKVRYEFLSSAAEELSADYVALGHNRDDQAETILMHIIRGTGLRGLGGMEEVRDLFIRPLLRTGRKEIEDYARSRDLDYRKDETNRNTRYTRNRIRHELIPELEDKYNPNIKERLAETGSLIREARSYLKKNTKKSARKILTRKSDSGTCFDTEKLSELSPYMKKAVSRDLMKREKGDLKDIGLDHVKKVLDKVEERPARTRIDLPGITFVLRRDYGCFVKDYSPGETEDYSYRVEPGEEVKVVEADLKLRFELTSDPGALNPRGFSRDNLTEIVDWGKVEQPLSVRNRRNGDGLVPLGMEGRKKLKDYFIDAKVPYEKRGEIPLVCDRRGIIWVVGHRLNERYKIDQTTEEGMIMKAVKP